MVEEGGVEPPFLPNFTMQLSCELIRAFNPCRSLRAPCIPATSVLPGYVARLVVNPVLSTLRKLNLWQTLSIFRSKSLSLHRNTCFTKNIYSL
nr:MAG TPA: hypothetical protein [Caudoviricetes sp.]